MSLTLTETQVISEIAAVMYDFLPGSGYSRWKGHTTFESVANELRLAGFWPGGSKLPAITVLLSQTLDRRPMDFEELVVAVVRASIPFRQKGGHSLTRDEVERLNRLLLRIGRKPTRLWDTTFLESLAVAAPSPTEDVSADTAVSYDVELTNMRIRFEHLVGWADRQAAGLELERVLNELFTLSDLKPRMPYKLTGEQIDGAFELDGGDYLVEAKWEAGRLGPGPLFVFHEKVRRKSSYTRGVLFAINGITDDAKVAYLRGEAPNFFIVDGYDVMCVLHSRIGLSELLRRKRTKLAQEGAIFISATELI